MIDLATIEPLLEWLPVGDTLEKSGLGCIDGRRRDCGFGVPGGNTGEAVLLLGVAEWYRDQPYTRAEIDEVIGALSLFFGSFHIHTDEEAVGKLAAHLGAPAADVTGWVTDGPPPERRAELLDAVARPEYIGCGHLASITSNADTYRVRRGLVEDIIRVVHARAWADQAEVHVLPGFHKEEALLVFHTADIVTEQTEVPALGGGTDRFFTDHVTVLRHIRNRCADTLRELDPMLVDVDPIAFLLEAERLGQRHLELTIAALAPELPRLRLRFNKDHVLRIEFANG